MVSSSTQWETEEIFNYFQQQCNSQELDELWEIVKIGNTNCKSGTCCFYFSTIYFSTILHTSITLNLITENKPNNYQAFFNTPPILNIYNYFFFFCLSRFLILLLIVFSRSPSIFHLAVFAVDDGSHSILFPSFNMLYETSPKLHLHLL